MGKKLNVLHIVWILGHDKKILSLNCPELLKFGLKGVMKGQNMTDFYPYKRRLGSRTDCVNGLYDDPCTNGAIKDRLTVCTKDYQPKHMISGQ